MAMAPPSVEIDGRGALTDWEARVTLSCECGYRVMVHLDRDNFEREPPAAWETHTCQGPRAL